MKKSLFLVVLAVLVAVFAVSCDGESAAAEPKKFTVKFESGVEGLDLNLPPQTVEEGKTAVKPADPTRDSYIFEGWKLGEEAFDFNTPITKDITLVASWGGVTPPDPEPETKYTVTFVYDDGTTANLEKEVVKDSKVEKPEDPTREGYAFKGWYIVNETEEKEFEFTTPITENLELKAKWEINKYTVTFDLNGGTADPVIGQKTVEHGKTATAPEDPTKTGHTFKYWSLDGSEFKFDTPIKKNITLKAIWEIKQYEIVFILNDGSTSSHDDDFVDYNKAVTEPSDPVRPGYEFKYWSTSVNGETGEFNFATLFTDEVAPSGTLELYAIWTQLFTVTSETSGSGSSVVTINTIMPTDAGKALEDVVIPSMIDGKTVTKIGSDAFKGCVNIVSVSIPKTVEEIGERAFKDCSAITTISIEEESILKTIASNAFDSCGKIESFAIPSSVATIGTKAFASCNQLKSIEIPVNVTAVANYAFSNCSELASVTINNIETIYGN